MSATPNTIRISRRFDASAETVFDCWIVPDRAEKWLFATPTGQMVKVEIDAHVGGSFIFTERRDGEDVEHVGTYLEIDRPRRLAFTFGVPKYAKELSTVRIDIAPLPAGCELTLTQEDVLPEWVERSREGWGILMDTLAVVSGEI